MSTPTIAKRIDPDAGMSVEEVEIPRHEADGIENAEQTRNKQYLDFAFELLERMNPNPRLNGRKVHVPSSLRWKIWERDDFRCHYCGSRRRLSIDHIVAECRGGETVESNLVTACRRCNSFKSTSSYGWMLTCAAMTLASHDKSQRRKDREIAMKWIERCVLKSFLFDGEKLVESLRSIFLEG